MADTEKKRKKKKGHGLLIAIVVAVLIMAGGIAVVCAELSKINQVGEGKGSTYTSEVAAVEGIKNILLIGQDRREGEDRQRSDSMILCSLNYNTNKITMVSLMRDMYVPIPDNGKNRINASYALGGMELLDATVENNFGIHIDGNVEVDFGGFMALIDKVGGVEIELSAEEAEYLNVNNTGLVDGVTTEAWSLTPGVNLLNAQQALAYARTRFIGNSDWERTDRQRTVLRAMATKLRTGNIGEQTAFITSALPLLTTDLSVMQIMEYGMNIVSRGMDLGEESFRLPVEGTYTSQSIDGMSVLVPDTEANAAYLKQYLGIS